MFGMAILNLGWFCFKMVFFSEKGKRKWFGVSMGYYRGDGN
jgi:hypothetical protein